MVTEVKNATISTNIDQYGQITPKEFRGKSTDTKPTTDVPNGSAFFEFNTKKVYMFDADAGTWGEI